MEWLERKLLEHGHEVERIYLPFVEDPRDMFAQMVAYRLIDLTESCDRLIAFRPPTYMLRHPCKILWFIHHFRFYYDLWNSEYRPVPDNVSGRAIRDTVFAADNATLGEARHIFTNSRTVSDRLRQFNGIASEVLYPPLRDPERFRCDGYGDEIVCISRMEHHKRQHLLIEALSYTRTPVKLCLCGVSNWGIYKRDLEALTNRLGLEERVIIEHRWITEEEKAERIAPALAVAYAPLDEDSYAAIPPWRGATPRKPFSQPQIRRGDRTRHRFESTATSVPSIRARLGTPWIVSSAIGPGHRQWAGQPISAFSILASPGTMWCKSC